MPGPGLDTAASEPANTARAVAREQEALVYEALRARGLRLAEPALAGPAASAACDPPVLYLLTVFTALATHRVAPAAFWSELFPLGGIHPWAGEGWGGAPGAPLSEGRKPPTAIDRCSRIARGLAARIERSHRGAAWIERELELPPGALAGKLRRGRSLTLFQLFHALALLELQPAVFFLEVFYREDLPQLLEPQWGETVELFDSLVRHWVELERSGPRRGSR